MRRWRRGGLVLLLACLATAVAGQYYFTHLRDRFWDGVVFYGVAVLCLILLLARRPSEERERAVSFWPRFGEALWTHLWRIAAFLAGLFCMYTACRLNEVGLNLQAVVFWLLGIVASIGAWVGLRQELLGPVRPGEPSPGAPRPDDPLEGEAGSHSGPGGDPGRVPPAEAVTRGDKVRAWARWALGWAAAHWEVLAVAGCTVLALLLRLVNVNTIPYVISGDEGSMGLEAINVLEGRLTNPFTTGWLSHPTLYFFMLAGPVRLLGRNAWGLRIFSPFVGAATIPVLYLLARRFFGRRVAVAGMVLLAVSHLHIHFSRLGINNIYDPLFGLLAFLFLVRGLEEGRVPDFALSGFFLGLAQFFYMGARLLPILVTVYVVLWGLRRRVRVGRLLLPAIAMGGAFVAAGAPMFRFFLLHPDDFMARIRMASIVQSGWLQTEPLVTGKPLLVLLWDQLRKSFFAFNYTLDPTSWYAAKIPYLDFVSGVLFLLGLVVLVWNWRKRGYLLVNVWFWLALILGGMLIENPPSSPRFVIFLPAVCLTVALGLVALLERTAGLIGIARAWVPYAMAVVLLAVVILNVGYYFCEYTPSGDFGGLNTEVGTRVGEYLRGQEPGSHVYFFGPPRMWVGYATIPFLAPGLDLHDVESPLTAPPDFVAPDGDALFVFLPERLGELGWVRQVCPQGRQVDIAGHTGEVLFIVYEVRR